MDSRQVRRTYRWMAPVYDPLFQRAYSGIRSASISRLNLGAADTVLLVGVGTGQDLAYMPTGATVVGVDLTPGMLRRGASRHLRRADFVLGDGSALPIATASMSAVVLHLVLGVAEEPGALIREAARVLRPGGKVAILDHFAPQGRPRTWRTIASRIPWLLGTHLDRRFEDLPVNDSFDVISDVLVARGLYRSITMTRL